MKNKKRNKRDVPEFQPLEPKVIEFVKDSKESISETDFKSLNILTKDYFKKYRKNYIYEINFPKDSQITQIKYSTFSHLLLYSITFPPSLSIIFPEAMKGCNYLEQIKFSKNDSNQSNLKFICDEAFKDTKISSIILPESIKEIGSYCFPSCISKIELENGAPELRKVCDAAFSQTQIEVFNMPTKIEPFLNSTNVFYKCKKLKTIIFDSFSNDEIIEDEESGFEIEERRKRKSFYFDNIQKVNADDEMSDNELEISQDFAKSLLFSQINIQKIEVLTSNLNYFYFFNTPNLTSIEIPKSDKAKYVIFQNCLYTIDKKKLIVAKRNITDSIISSNCEIIANYAFNVKSLEKVSFEENSELKEISFLAFFDSQIQNINLPNSVDFIDYGAFYKCKQLETINIPHSMNWIDFFTFAYTNLATIIIPRNIARINFGSFLGCNNLKSVIFENESNLVEIDDYAFAFTNISSISIPKNVKRIGNYSFANCYQLKSINFEDYTNITSIGFNCFLNTQIDSKDFVQFLERVDFTRKSENDEKIFFMKPSLVENITQIFIPSKVEEISFHAFFDCAVLEKVQIIDFKNSKLQTISSGAFYNCTSLKDFQIPASVNYFGTNSFKNCINYKDSINISNDEKIIIGKNAFEHSGISAFKTNANKLLIDDFAFHNCHNLTIFSANVVKRCEIGKSAFKNCELLSEVEINDTVRRIEFGEKCFKKTSITKFEIPHCLINIPKSCFKFCKKLKNVIFNESCIYYFGSKTFYETGIEQIFIPSDVRSIGKSCFENCTNLHTLTFSDYSFYGLVIDENAFFNSGITELCIPKGINKIKNGCFENCSNLANIIFDNDSKLKRIEDNVFKSTGITKLSLPPSVKKIGKSSFQNCSKLTHVEFHGKRTTIHPSSFYECYQINHLTSESPIKICDNSYKQWCYFIKLNQIKINEIKDFLVKNEKMASFRQAFFSFSYLLIDENIKINSNMNFVKHINDCYYSPNMDVLHFVDFAVNEILISKETRRIAEQALTYSCLTKIDFEKCSQLSQIGKSSFRNLLIEEITIPDSVVFIDEFAFSCCYKLKTVNIGLESKLKGIRIGAFEKTAIETILFPSGLTFIQDFAFYRCTHLVSVDNYSNQIEFGYESFYHSSIKEIKFPSFAIFGCSSFRECKNLKQLSFLNPPVQIKFEIDSFAFSGIENINLDCKVDINENAFSFCPDLKKVTLKGHDVNCNRNSFSYSRIVEYDLNINIKTNEKQFDPKNFMYIKDLIVLSDIEKMYLNLTFQNHKYDLINQINICYENNCFVMDGKLLYANLINNIFLCKKDNDAENKSDNVSDEIKCNEILKVPQNVKQLNFPQMLHLKKIEFYPNIEDLGPPGFFSHYNLIEITIPRKVEKIAPHLFEHCHFLKTVKFEKGSILNEIGEYSFSNTRIKEIILPDSVRIIKQSAFSYNNELETVIFNGEIIDKESFIHTGIKQFKLSNNTRYIGSSAFQYCHSLVKFDIDIDQSNLSEIDEYAFSESSIIEINIPSKIETIKRFTFNGCSKLKRVNISNKSNLYEIDEYSFAGDLSLETINIPKSISKLSSTAFINTPSLNTIMLESNDKFTVMKEQDVYINSNINCQELIFVPRSLKKYHIINKCYKISSGSFCGPNLEEIIFPDNSIKIIGYCSFGHSTGLKNIKIPKSIEIIEKEAFIDCQNLQNVEFDELCSVKVIPKYCFAFTGIKSINLPKSIEIISDFSFYLCSNLTDIDLSNTSVRYIGNSSFSGTQIEEIIFPPTIAHISNYSFENMNSLKLVDFTKCEEIKEHDIRIDSKISIHSFISQNKGIKRITSLNEPQEAFYVQESSFYNSAVKIFKFNLKEYKWFNFFDKCAKIEEYIINSNILLYLERMRKERWIKTKKYPNDYLSGNLYNISGFIWGNDDFIVNSARRPNLICPFHFLNSSKLTKVTLTDDLNIKLIPKCLFADTYLKEITIPSTVLEIKASAFKSCYQLKKVSFLNNSRLQKIGIFAFYECKNLKYFLIPRKVKTISFKCFALSGLTKISFPKTIEKVEKFAFFNCESLSNVILNEGLRELGDSSFANNISLQSINIPNSLRKISKKTFSNCLNLKQVNTTEKSRLVEIHNFSFENTQIEELTLNPRIKILFEPLNVPNLNKISFYDGNLIHFKQYQDGTIYERVNYYYKSARKEENIKEELEFVNDDIKFRSIVYDLVMIHSKRYKLVFAPKNLKNLKIHECCQSIGNYVLHGMKELTRIEFVKGSSNLIQKFPNFYNENNHIKKVEILGNFSYIENAQFSYFHSLEVVEFGELSNLFFVPKYAFENCKKLKKISIPCYCKMIDEGAFKNCTKLSSVEFKIDNQKKYFFSKLTTIGKEAFYNCLSLLNISIPSTVSVIGKKAFMNCKRLKIFEIENKDFCFLKIIGESSFQNCISLEKISFSTNADYLRIKNSAFRNCKKLNEVSLKGRSLYNIDFRAFYSCISLIDFKFKYFNTLKEHYFNYIFIGFESFMNCISMKQIILDNSSAKDEKETPENIKLRKQAIQTKAFYNCKKLKKVQIFIGNLENIQEYAFKNCYSLQKLEINANEKVFLGENLNYDAFEKVPKNLTIKLINTKKEIHEFNIKNMKKPQKTRMKAYKEHLSFLNKSLICDDTNDNDSK